MNVTPSITIQERGAVDTWMIAGALLVLVPGGHIIVQEMKLNYWQIVTALPRCIAAPASTTIISIAEGKHVPTFFATRGPTNV